MIIEERIGNDCLFLVDKETDKGVVWRDIEGAYELGNGNQLYYFEVIGENFTQYIKALVWADNDENLSTIIKKEFDEKTKDKNIILEKTLIIRLYDERNK